MPKDDLDRYRATCTRFLGGHGLVSTEDWLATIPRDASRDRYGEGGAVAHADVDQPLRELLHRVPLGQVGAAQRLEGEQRGGRAVA